MPSAFCSTQVGVGIQVHEPDMGLALAAGMEAANIHRPPKWMSMLDRIVTMATLNVVNSPR